MKIRLTLFLILLNSGNIFSQTPNQLIIPPVLSGTTFNLDVMPDSVQFLAGTKTETYGINQDYLGPTLILNRGDYVQMNVTNSLSDTTTMHWHGLHVPAADDGGPHTPIPPGTTWSPNFTVLDEASTYWYHPHLHMHTAQQVYLGAAGMIIVHDSLENSLGLPHTYGVDDFPMIIQDKSFDSLTNQLFFEALSDTVMINGTFNPYLEVPAQMVRFRFLNASNQRVYNLGFPVGVANIISSDGGLLAQPLPITRMLLAPGERVEVVIDFSSLSGNLPMNSFCSEMGQGVSGGPNGPGGGPGNPLDGNDFQILEFRVVPQTVNPVTTLPANLRTYNIPNELDAAVTRYKVITVDSAGFPFYINDLVYQMDYNNDTVMLGDIEIWELSNLTDVAHPLHIHDVQFNIIEVNGGQPPGHLLGRKDVILLLPGDTVRFITRFDDFADENTPYMYHCHNLFHEDGGMMAQFIVMDTAAVGVHQPIHVNSEARVKCYPNPTNGILTLEDLEYDHKPVTNIEIWDMFGNKVSEVKVDKNSAFQILDISKLADGLYLILECRTNGEKSVLKVCKQ